MVPLLLDNLLCLGASLGGLVLLLALLHLQERLVSRHVAHHLGWRAVLLTGWLGVPLHELAHLLAAKLFGHRIIAWKLLDPDPVSGTLGYVRHAYSRRSLWQLAGTFFIGTAPLVAGAGALLLLLAWMLPAEAAQRLLRQLSALGTGTDDAWHGLAALGRTLVAALWRGRSLLLPLQLYLAVCVAHHLAPSPADLRGALPGFALLAALAAAATAVASASGVSLRVLPAFLLPLVLLLPVTTLLLGLWALLARVLGRVQRPMIRGSITD